MLKSKLTSIFKQLTLVVGILFFSWTLSIQAIQLDSKTDELVKIPPLKALVTDLTNTLTPEQTYLLENQLRSYERAKGTQIAVLIIPTTQPESIEQYSIRVVDQWKLGRKKLMTASYY
jgi:uncharacterized protein